MSPRDLLLENTQLKARLAKRESLIGEREAAIQDRDATIERLAQDLDTLRSHLERLLASRRRDYMIAEGQGVLFPSDAPKQEETAEHANEAPDGETPDDRIKRRARPKSPAKKIDFSALAHVEEVHELPEEERFCPESGLELVPVGEKTFDEIQYERARLVVVHHRRIVYGLPPEIAAERQASSITAPMPPRPLEGCTASAVLLAWILVQKYAHHLPLYRQEQIFQRDGLRLPRQTMCDWVLAAADLLKPIVDHLMGKIRAGPIMQLDDTPVVCQGGKGKGNFQAYLWTFASPSVEGIAYRFTAGRGSGLIANELEGFEGFLVGDGYSGNAAAAKQVRGEIVLAGCWAHAARKFRDARNEVPGTARLFGEGIKLLYAVEGEATDSGLDEDARLALRERKSRPILASIFKRARRLRDDFSDAGSMAKAMSYLLNQRKPLRRFLESGSVPIDNNVCERAIRPVAIGRRNWLFAGSVKGGEAAATIYTLIECCRIAEVDMVDYLADVLVKVTTHPVAELGELLPAEWARARALAAPEAVAAD